MSKSISLSWNLVMGSMVILMTIVLASWSKPIDHEPLSEITSATIGASSSPPIKWVVIQSRPKKSSGISRSSSLELRKTAIINHARQVERSNERRELRETLESLHIHVDHPTSETIGSGGHVDNLDPTYSLVVHELDPRLTWLKSLSRLGIIFILNRKSLF